MNPIPEQENKFFVCDCYCEALMVTSYNPDTDEEVYLAMFKRKYYYHNPSILRRLKYAWYHIRTGKKYEDELVLSYDKARELGNHLLKITEKAK